MCKGYSQHKQKHLASWNPARGVWETPQTQGLCGHSELFSVTWPAAGSMRNGKAYEHLTQVPHIEEPGCSLLRTPVASELEGGLINPGIARSKNQTIRLGAQILELIGEI